MVTSQAKEKKGLGTFRLDGEDLGNQHLKKFRKILKFIK